MAAYMPFPMCLTVARHISKDLASGINVAEWLGSICRCTGLNVDMLNATDLEKQAEKYVHDEAVGLWARIASDLMKAIRRQAEAQRKAATVVEKTTKKTPLQCIKNLQKTGGTKRHNEDKGDPDYEPKQKIYKFEEKEEDSEDQTTEVVKSKKMNSSFVDPAAVLAEKLKELPSKPTRSDAQKLARSFGQITPSLLQDAEDLIGRRMRRVDEVWWLLLLIKFGLPKTNISLDVREVFAKEERKQMKKDKQCVQRLNNLYGKS